MSQHTVVVKDQGSHGDRPSAADAWAFMLAALLDDVTKMSHADKTELRDLLATERDQMERMFGPPALSMIGSIIGYLPLKTPR